jgi:ADP-ribosyl-[dinitrogen reductase] hydrolase
MTATTSPPATKEALSDRYRGAMVGLAIGNALGVPVEGFSATLIRRRFPEGVRDIAPDEQRLPWDDDIAHAVLLSESILEHDRCDLDDLARRLEAWRRENGRGIGHLTRRVLDAIAAGKPAQDAARAVWKEADRNAAGNGAVMRCPPVALRWRRHTERLIAESRQSALVTHHDPRCGWSAAALNLAVAAALEGGSIELPELADALADAGAPLAVGQAVGLCAGAALDAFDLDHDNSMGYTLKVMQAGLWALEQDGDAESVLIAVINAGGDTDTNGAVAGAALGAKHGLSAWPTRWRERIRDEATLHGLADRLLERAES